MMLSRSKWYQHADSDCLDEWVLVLSEGIEEMTGNHALDKATSYYDQIIKEAIHIKINDIFNREVCIQISSAWLPVICSISLDNTHTQPPGSQNQTCWYHLDLDIANSM